jgi:hypothetical protein
MAARPRTAPQATCASSTRQTNLSTTAGSNWLPATPVQLHQRVEAPAGGPVGAVRGHGAECVAHRDDAARERDRLPPPVRVGSRCRPSARGVRGRAWPRSRAQGCRRASPTPTRGGAASPPTRPGDSGAGLLRIALGTAPLPTSWSRAASSSSSSAAEASRSSRPSSSSATSAACPSSQWSRRRRGKTGATRRYGCRSAPFLGRSIIFSLPLRIKPLVPLQRACSTRGPFPLRRGNKRECWERCSPLRRGAAINGLDARSPNRPARRTRTGSS